MQDVNSIVKQMTLEEKAALCTGASAWTTVPVERLGVPAIIVSDGPHGVRRVSDVHALGGKSLPATCFPTASCLASSWDVDLLYEVGQALGEECIALDVDVLLGPGNNMKRTPLCGRNFEYYSEDPYLSGELGASFINGVQSKGVGTSLKHYAANNQETKRFTVSAEVDERTLREIYLPAFETSVKKAQPWTVMCAYNRLNGVYGSENTRLLVDILKREWGFAGFVVSDWGAVHDRVAALQGGLDLEMPGPKDLRVQDVIQAVKAGELDEAVLDEAVTRILGIIFKAKETPKGHTEFDVDEHHALARRVAAEGMVLLKNAGNLLPLQGVASIAVIGRAAQEATFQGGGSSHINPTRVDVPFTELQKLAGDAELVYAEGYPSTREFNQALIDGAVKIAKDADVALLYIALPTYKESEGSDRPDIDLTEQQVALIKAVGAVQPKTVVILNNGTAVAMSDWIDSVAVVMEAWLMGQAGGGAIADVLFGKVNPGGKLTETFPLKLSDTPAYLNFPGEAGKVRYGEGLFIGYRYYDTKEIPVQFPFGYGLSYTTFAYANPQVSARIFKDTDGLTVSVDVTNTGAVAGKEVVQVYVHDHAAALMRPAKELKGFAKVALEPGETRTVTITLDQRAFAYFHPEYNQWITEDGDFDILIGRSSADIVFTETVTLESTFEPPCLLNRDSTFKEWKEDPRGLPVITPILDEMMSSGGINLGSDDDEGGLGMEVMEMMEGLPLLAVFHFQEQDLPKPADTLIDELLAQVHKQS